MKKKIVPAALAVSAAAVIGTNVHAAGAKYNSKDLKDLNDYLLGKGELSGDFDLDDDGVVDGFDMVLMRRAMLDLGEFKQTVCPASEENVKFIGRNLVKDDVTWLVHSGSAVEFTVTARSAELDINAGSGISSDKDQAPRYAVLINDEVILDDVITSSKRTVELFSGSELRTVKVKVIHLSEANSGVMGVSAIRTDSSVADPVKPTPEKDLRIEFIGDSITCAYGVEGASQNESFKTTTENFMKSYAYLTAQKLDADYSAVSYSGHGIISGYTSGEKNTGQLVPPYYEMIGKFSPYNVSWDFSAKPNDVVVINLGTNDSSYIDKDFETRSPEFTVEYEKFLVQVRKNNPDAYIICTLGTMGGADEYKLIEEAVANYKKNTGDERIMNYWSVTHTQSDGYGSDWHPSEKTQQRSAYVLADKICQVLGIESDQIGLDMASEAEYELVCDKESGANAASYFSDYDRSFWMNTVTGGKEPDDIEARIKGIEIKKDGKYRLTFKCTSPAGMEIPVLLRSKDGSEVYYTDKFTGGGEKVPFEAELTAPAADKNAEIVLQIGGKDYSNVSLYELKLEKIG